MKFICQSDNTAMEFVETVNSDDGGSMSIHFRCPTCGRGIAMVTNSGETQMVRSLGVTIGGAPSSEPMAMIRSALTGQSITGQSSDGAEPAWSEAALKRLAAAPVFVQGMIRRLYSDYAKQKGYAEITPAIMTEARDALGMSGM
ncbi:MAG: PCP reductase family protein [Chloroflexi bacterium]|nr:PCP reductase family protein [Chloroflexota bacterium]